MCISCFAFEVHKDLLFLLAFNRDELLTRVTAPPAFWTDHPQILGGRDNQRQGTWLGVTTSGRVSFVTNYKERANGHPRSPTTRGGLTVDFLLGEEQPLTYLESLDLSKYSGFNLVVADLLSGSVAYRCNRKDTVPRTIGPGVHVMSNGHIDDTWPKMKICKEALVRVLNSGEIEGHNLPWETIFNDVLGQAKRVEDESLLPNTGVGIELEKMDSGVFVEPFDKQDGLHGTRSQTVLAVWRDGHAEYRERWLDFPTGQWHEVNHTFAIGRAFEGLPHGDEL
ncbi:unnamed protein product [Ostreobium quekettii]|uniref:DUF833-domain-containing protein n=1 Tax=Ostreobium quekettii TaxID=121088 RepID=A0A8S1JC15_9CHLO|nr:unnamed protein product [Ostreobium quekettii]